MSGNLQGISEVAKIWGVSPYTVRRLIDAGYIKAVNVAARRLIPSSEVERVSREGAGAPRKRERVSSAQKNVGKTWCIPTEAVETRLKARKANDGTTRS